MVDWEKLAKKANEVLEKRGGVKSVQQDAGELGEIAKGDGTLSEKARAAMKAIKEPGAHEQGTSSPEGPAQSG